MIHKEPNIVSFVFENNNSFITMDFENILGYKDRKEHG
jgi:hypothetical protein